MKLPFNFLNFLFIGCVLFAQSSSHAEPYNLGLLQKELIQYHDSGLYLKELTQKITQAEDLIFKKARQHLKRHPQEKLALVLDIDETSLSNYEKIVHLGFSSNKKLVHKAIMTGEAPPPIKPMLALYKKALKMGIHVFFVTGRQDLIRKETEEQLHQAGYQNWTDLYLKPNDYAKDSVIPYKSAIRAHIEQLGYTILATIGDQDSDLRGGYAEMQVKLPNPYYYLP